MFREICDNATDIDVDWIGSIKDLPSGCICDSTVHRPPLTQIVDAWHIILSGESNVLVHIEPISGDRNRQYNGRDRKHALNHTMFQGPAKAVRDVDNDVVRVTVDNR